MAARIADRVKQRHHLNTVYGSEQVNAWKYGEGTINLVSDDDHAPNDSDSTEGEYEYYDIDAVSNHQIDANNNLWFWVECTNFPDDWVLAENLFADERLIQYCMLFCVFLHSFSYFSS